MCCAWRFFKSFVKIICPQKQMRWTFSSLLEDCSSLIPMPSHVWLSTSLKSNSDASVNACYVPTDLILGTGTCSGRFSCDMRSDVCTVVITHITMFCNMTPCSLIDHYQWVEAACLLHCLPSKALVFAFTSK
jgi:hypothetical protein